MMWTNVSGLALQTIHWKSEKAIVSRKHQKWRIYVGEKIAFIGQEPWLEAMISWLAASQSSQAEKPTHL